VLIQPTPSLGDGKLAGSGWLYPVRLCLVACVGSWLRDGKLLFINMIYARSPATFRAKEFKLVNFWDAN
jgi:hypothetical protein